MILRKNRKRKFQKNRLCESLEDGKNPGRGWYHIYTYDLSEELPELYIACEEETIALLLIDIGQFQKECIPEDALEYLKRILDFFHQHEKKMILRPVYDTTGNGMQREPASIRLIKEHMKQLGTVIETFAPDILVVQGILVGDWGEMHGSKFLSEEYLTELADAYMEAMHGTCFLAVRTPSQWKTIIKSLNERMKKQLVIFNDGILGSETDLGTFRSSEERRNWLKMQADTLSTGPVGGEAVLCQKEYKKASGQIDPYEEKLPDKEIKNRKDMEILRKMQLTYLNSTHDQKLLDKWKSQMMNWDGHQTSMYEYIGLHLGYRFIIRDIVWKKNKFLEANVENSGFAEIYEETECVIEFRNASKDPDRAEEKKSECISLDCDARNWKSGTMNRIQIPADRLDQYLRNVNKQWNEEIEVCLHLRCKQDGRPILFANENAENGVLLGTFR